MMFNKKADIGDIFLYVGVFFVIAIILIIVAKVGINISRNLSPQLSDSPLGNYSLQKLELMPKIFNYVMLTIFIAMIIGLIASVLTLDVHPLYFIAFIIAGFFILMIAVIFSNVYENVRDSATLTEVTDQFTVVNHIFSYFPLYCFIILLLTGIILYSKMVGGPTAV